jgi:hypothetical protein
LLLLDEIKIVNPWCTRAMHKTRPGGYCRELCCIDITDFGSREAKSSDAICNVKKTKKILIVACFQHILLFLVGLVGYLLTQSSSNHKFEPKFCNYLHAKLMQQEH